MVGAGGSAVGAAAHPAPRHLGRGGSSSLQRVRGAGLPGCSQGRAVGLQCRRGEMGSAPAPWWAGTQAAGDLRQAGGCSRDTGSPGDTQICPSSNCPLISQRAGWSSAGPQ